MNARDYKIRSILIQRGFIENQLNGREKVINENGLIDYAFIGEIYPENIKYLKDLGYEVIKTVKNCIEAKARPIYLIYPSDEIILTDEEMKKAENFKFKLYDDFASIFDDDSQNDGMKQ